jgi:hypothetical protein
MRVTSRPAVIHQEARLLRDLILTEARFRGIHLEAHSLRVDFGLPVLQVALDGKLLRRCSVRLPGRPGSTEPDVITVHGSGFRTSRMWPRKNDGTFNIDAVTTYLLALVQEEVSRPKPRLEISRVAAAQSGIHVVHAAAVCLGKLALSVTVDALVLRVEDAHIRQRIEGHLVKDGLTDGDMRALADATGLFLCRDYRIDDDDLLQPIDDSILRVLRIGRPVGTGIERRYVLLLDRSRNSIDVADPGGMGLAKVTAAKLRAAWVLGAAGRPWVASISSKWPASHVTSAERHLGGTSACGT